MREIEERGKTDRLVAMIVGVVAIALGAFGVWLTALGAGQAQSVVHRFGQKVSTTSVGLGAIFVAGSVLAYVLVRVLRR